ncbi:MAG: ATP-binding protein [Armatimonadetes bacterium]|nr:ATP-binding protein [Armatimonadota bacterium]
MERSLLHWISMVHPPDKMLFLSGPRQVGKTTLAGMAISAWPAGSRYMNWDIAEDRLKILRNEDLLAPVRRVGERVMIVFDELHKMNRFKQWLKGWHDSHSHECLTWVTGSGRLDLYQRGGDSLLGRYFPYRLHPLSVAELGGASSRTSLPDPDTSWKSFSEGESRKVRDDVLHGLMRFGGFPEPYLKQSASFHVRWLGTRRGRVTQEDIRDLTRISDIARLELLVALLAPRVGSPLSLNSLREDLNVAFETVRTWLAALERTYYVFTVPPFSRRVSRALSKSRKAYFWDWSEVPESPSRLENLVASHLLKACHVWSDLGCGRFELWYVRDKQKREVDFLISESGRPWLLCECKLTDKRPAPSLISFGKMLDCSRLVQLVEPQGVREIHRFGDSFVHVSSAGYFLAHLV